MSVSDEVNASAAESPALDRALQPHVAVARPGDTLIVNAPADTPPDALRRMAVGLDASCRARGLEALLFVGGVVAHVSDPTEDPA